MPSTGEKKLIQMRAYAKTPAGREAKARARANTALKRGASTRTKKSNHKPLAKAMALWR